MISSMSSARIVYREGENFMKRIRMENGKKMEKILKAVGPMGATVKKEGQ